MKVLHIGVKQHSVAALAKRHARQCDQVAQLFVQDQDGPLFNLPAPIDECKKRLGAILYQQFNIIHCHGPEALNWLAAQESSFDTLARELAAAGSALIYSSSIDVRKESSVLSGMLPLMSHLFITSPASLELTQSRGSWSWLPLPVELDLLPAPEPYTPALHNVKILFIETAWNQVDAPLVREAVSMLQMKGLKFNFTHLQGRSIPHYDELHRRILECDLLIEQVQGSSYGSLALEALARGKSVLSGNHSPGKEIWIPTQMNPILDTTPQNLCRRLDAIIREPRCLRDLGKRSRAYVDQLHAIPRVHEYILQMYEEVLSNQRRHYFKESARALLA